MPSAVIISSIRSPIGKSHRGALRVMRPDDIAAQILTKAVARVPGLRTDEIEDIHVGCAFPEAEQGMNLAQIVGHRAGLPPSFGGVTMNRFCASGLQAIASASHAVSMGQAEIIAAGGVESMSLIEMGGNDYRPNPHLVEHYPDVYTAMGITAENVAECYGVSRAEQDVFALESHRRALGAIEAGDFSAETAAIAVPGARSPLTKDEGPRADTSLEKLAALKPVFKAGGTVTAGNSSQTSDGAAFSLVTTEARARALGVAPLARLVAYAVAGVEPRLMGIGPVAAVPKALRQAGLTVRDLGLVELNEAFAAQALAVIRVLGLDPATVNIAGGAIALGHPLGCTGARLTATLLHAMRRRRVRYGLCTMCIGGGQGAAAIFENLSHE